MNTKQTSPRRPSAPQRHQDAARALIATAGSAAKAAKLLGIDGATFARVVAGLEVNNGTLAILRERFDAPVDLPLPGETRAK